MTIVAADKAKPIVRKFVKKLNMHMLETVRNSIPKRAGKLRAIERLDSIRRQTVTRVPNDVEVVKSRQVRRAEQRKLDKVNRVTPAELARRKIKLARDMRVKHERELALKEALLKKQKLEEAQEKNNG